MSPSEITLPLLLMYDGDEVFKIIVCWTLVMVVYVPIFAIIFTPAVGIFWMPIAGIAAAATYNRNHSGIYADTAFQHGIKYSVISIFLWFHLIHRIKRKSISRGAIQAAYALSYAQWGIWYVMYFILDMIDPRQRAIAEIPFTSIEIRLYTFAAVVSLLTLTVSFIRLYRARWNPKLSAQEPADRAWFEVMPASVYVMPFVWANLWLTWLMMLWVYNMLGSSETPLAWPIVFYLFVVAAASIIWMLWSPMKLVAQRAKRMIVKQAES